MAHKKWLLMVLIPLVFLSCGKDPGPDPQLVETKIRNILNFHTYEMLYKDIAFVGKSEKLFGVFTMVDKRLLFSVKIRVRAGIDIAKGFKLEPMVGPLPRDSSVGIWNDEQTATNKKAHGVRVILPPSEILLIDADETSFEEYFIYEYGAEITRSEWNNQVAQARDRVAQDALERGILVKAEENIKALLVNILNVAGYSYVEFETIDSTAVAPMEGEGVGNE